MFMINPYVFPCFFLGVQSENAAKAEVSGAADEGRVGRSLGYNDSDSAQVTFSKCIVVFWPQN